MSRVAIFHDNLVQLGGAERVLLALAKALPEAALHTTLAVPARLGPELQSMPVRTTWMRHLPAARKLYRHYFLLYPLAVEMANLRHYDVIISSCWGYSKGVRKKRGGLHVCYCYTPMRCVWRYDDYISGERLSSAVRRLLPLLIAPLRWWDLRASKRPDYFIAISEVVAERIRRFYGRTAVVIPPPVDVQRFYIAPTPGDYYLVISRLLAYKRIELAIKACNQLGRRLVIIGDGPDRARLTSLAGATVEFLGRQPDEVVTKMAAECRAVIFAGEEDFGIVPLEANAAGRPVVAWRGGGALETVREGRTGVFFDSPTPEAVAAAIEHLETCQWDSQLLRAHAESFDTSVFIARIRAYLQSLEAPTAAHTRLEPLHA